MATYRYVTVDHPEGWRLKDLASIRMDFERCLGMCEVVLSRPIDEFGGMPDIDAFGVAIPVVYARPFSGGCRIRVTDLVSTRYSPEQQVHHERILMLRSRHTAHSLNRMEEQQLCVWLNPEERGRRINNVNANHHFSVTISPGDYERLAGMCRLALDWIDAEALSEQERLKELIGAQYPLDELYRMDSHAPNLAKLEAAAKGRRNKR